MIPQAARNRVRRWYDVQVAACADEAVEHRRYKLTGADVTLIAREILRRAVAAQRQGELPSEMTISELHECAYAAMRNYFQGTSRSWRKVQGALYHDLYWGERVLPPTRKRRDACNA